MISNNFYFNAEISNRLPEAFIILSAIYLAFTILGLCLMTDPVISQDTLVNAKANESLAGPLKSKVFWLIIFMIICSLAPGYYVFGNYKTFAKDFINDDFFLAFVGSISSLVDGSSRFLSGTAMDRFSFKVTYGTILIIQALGLMLIYFAVQVKVLYLFCVALVLGSKGAQFVLFTTLCSEIWGER